MKILVCAYQNVGYECLKVLIKNKENIVAVFTHKDNPQENIWFKSVKKLALRNKIKVIESDININENIEIIKSLAPDIIFSFYYRNLICEEILNIAKRGAFNIHGSLLPKYRGRCPINWVLVNGEKQTGVTLHKMVKRADAGDIAAQEKIKISLKDNAYTLSKKVSKKSAKLLNKLLPELKKNKIKFISQDEKKATYFGGRKPEDGKINWDKSAIEIYNLIRAVAYPFPGAFTFYNKKKLFIRSAKPIKLKKKNKEVGKIKKENKKNIFISCGIGILKVPKNKISLETKEKINLPVSIKLF